MAFKDLFLLLLAAVALGIVLLAVATADFGSVGKGLFEAGGSAECVGVVRLEGVIDSEPAGSFFSSQRLSESMAESLEQADDDPAIGSVLLLINSPGGSAAESKEIYDYVTETKKPVVAYFSDVAASGGYYVASASDYIIANPNAITGSIGARATIINYEELFGKVGLRVDSFKTGELKDIGDGYRNVTQKEREVIGAVLNETLENFEGDVRRGRQGKLNEKLFAESLDARILTSRQALRAGLIDEIGSRHAALRKAAFLGNVTFEEGKLPKVCELVEGGGLGSLLSSISSGFARGLVEGLNKPRVSLRYEA